MDEEISTKLSLIEADIRLISIAADRGVSILEQIVTELRHSAENVEAISKQIADFSRNVSEINGRLESVIYKNVFDDKSVGITEVLGE